jgi:hypothetical protein
MPDHPLSISSGLIERRIYVIRGQKVMLDSGLAEQLTKEELLEPPPQPPKRRIGFRNA